MLTDDKGKEAEQLFSSGFLFVKIDPLGISKKKERENRFSKRSFNGGKRPERGIQSLCCSETHFRR